MNTKQRPLINVTPTPINLSSGEVLNPSGFIVQAAWNEVIVGRDEYNNSFVTPRPIRTEEGTSTIDQLRREFKNPLLIGSMLCAMAFPGDVVSTVSVAKGKGTKWVNSSKFSMFPNEYLVEIGSEAGLAVFGAMKNLNKELEPYGFEVKAETDSSGRVRGLKIVEKKVTE
jgi:hypothetical protein